MLLAVVAVACAKAPQELTDMGAVPAWELTNEQGRRIGSETLKGQVWVANFLFTSCPTSCPPLAKATKDVQERIRKWLPADGSIPVQIVSVSVDPVTDTPAVLREFGKRHGADPNLWQFATGSYDAMERLVTDGFMLPIVRSDRPARGLPGHEGNPATQRPTPLDTAHSLQFVVVDGEGHIRGLYTKDPASLAQLDTALQYLVGQL
jgi:protein SCO1/2